jgi:hypothetical protein
VPGAPTEDWKAIDSALYAGRRGLPRGESLARLLAKHRGQRNHRALPPLTIDQILAWADAHHKRTGNWPKSMSGSILDAREESWQEIDRNLRFGLRSLPGGQTLKQLLAQQRNVREPKNRTPLRIEQILKWARAYQKKTGHWPKTTSGDVEQLPGETWHNIYVALKKGQRGLSGGSSLTELFARYRSKPGRKAPRV